MTNNNNNQDSRDNVVKIPVNIPNKNNDNPLSQDENKETETKEIDIPENIAATNEIAVPEESTQDEKIKELEETVKRLYADFDNFRKRKEEEVVESRKRAVERVVLEILPIMDNFERAIAASEDTENYAALKEGLVMVHKQIYHLLVKEGVAEIEAEGKPFNPEEHQVVNCESSPELEEDTIIKELLKGYKLFDRVIRPSMVVVAKN